MNDKRNINQILLKVGLLAGVIVLGLIAISIYKETQQKKQKQAIIDALIEEKDRISRDNSILQEKLAYYGSSEYAEKQSKELNKQKPDEHLIVVRPNMLKENVVEQPAKIIVSEKKESLPNYQKWWDYLFKY